MHISRRALLASLSALSLAAPVFGASTESSEDAETRELLDSARATVFDFTTDPDFAGFRKQLSSAKAVLVFPHIFAAGLVLGGAGGNGVLMVRDDRTGEWTGPVFYTIGGVSVGVQAGAVNGSLALVLRSEKALDSIYKTSTKLGGNATVALGSKSATASRAVSSDFVAYSKVKGAFAGVAVNGMVLDVRKSLNDSFYGKSLSPAQMVLSAASSTPVADGLRQTLKGAAL